MYDVRKFGEADSLRVTVLVEDYAGYESEYWGSHGIALLLDVKAGDTDKRILLDVGQSSDALLHNMELAGVEPASIDMIFLSHCHYDHTLALVDMLKHIGKEIPVIGHPEVLRKNFALDPALQEIGAGCKNTPEKLVELGAQLVLVKDPFPLMEGVLSTGEVERSTDFEGRGIGTYNLENGKLVPDNLVDDISVIVNLRGKGLYIVTGCSHAGIVNIIEHAKRVTGIDSIFCIIGGLHLINADDQVIAKTIDRLEGINPRLVIPGHCTGQKAQYRLWERFGKRYRSMNSGSVFEFSAPAL
jgi:7,8-dihydropterin-6-yl-methyl-4-(beta-D-ribofuranosyl)aminobenzene 5'-phosphate synthase